MKISMGVGVDVEIATVDSSYSCVECTPHLQYFFFRVKRIPDEVVNEGLT